MNANRAGGSEVPGGIRSAHRSPAVNTARVVGIAIGILVELAGLVLLVPPAYHLIQYWMDTDSPVRHEALMGFGLSIIPPTLALGLTAIIALLCRSTLSRAILLCMVVPGAIMAVVTFVFLLVPMTLALLFEGKI